MEHQFILSGASTKEERYREFLSQFESLVRDVDDEIAVLANAAAALGERRLPYPRPFSRQCGLLPDKKG